MTAASALPLRLWLPALGRFGAGHPLRRWLQRAERRPAVPAGYLPMLATEFGLAADTLPAAALLRHWFAGDAGGAAWLAADPAWVQPDLNGARLLACGQLQLSMDEARQLGEALQPVVREAGLELHVSSPDRWQLRLPDDLPLPAFPAPERALGEDLFQHLPQGEQGRRWRLLNNDIQVLLHTHPLNAERRRRGLPPVNSLWLWGAGRLPASLDTPWLGLLSDDPLQCALASRARIDALPRTPEGVREAGAGWRIDLQDLPVETLDQAYAPVIEPLLARQPVELAFAGGECWLHRPWHRWRLWRRGQP